MFGLGSLKKSKMLKIDHLDTILPRQDLPENQEEMPEIGQRIRLSKGDIAQTMALYGCPCKKKTIYKMSVHLCASLRENLFQFVVVHFKTLRQHLVHLKTLACTRRPQVLMLCPSKW